MDIYIYIYTYYLDILFFWKSCTWNTWEMCGYIRPGKRLHNYGLHLWLITLITMIYGRYFDIATGNIDK